MKPEQSTGGKSLRIVGLAITLVSVVVFSTIAYSAYVDGRGVISAITGAGVAPIKTVATKTDTTILVNITIPNDGLYPVSLSFECSPPPGSPLSCSTANITVPPGQTGFLNFSITMDNATSGSLSGLSLPGNATVSLDPFASITVSFNLGHIVSQGGA